MIGVILYLRVTFVYCRALLPPCLKIFMAARAGIFGVHIYGRHGCYSSIYTFFHKVAEVNRVVAKNGDPTIYIIVVFA